MFSYTTRTPFFIWCWTWDSRIILGSSLRKFSQCVRSFALLEERASLAFHHRAHTPQTSPRPSVRDYVDAFLLTGFNTLLVEPALLYAGYVSFYPAMGHCAWSEEQCTTKPSFLWSLLSLVVFSLVFEVGFYFSHFAMHQKPFYRLIHKTHHRFKSREHAFFHACFTSKPPYMYSCGPWCQVRPSH